MKLSVRVKILLVVGFIVVGSLALNTALDVRLMRSTYIETSKQGALIGVSQLHGQLTRLLNFGIPVEELNGFDEQCNQLLDDNEDFAFAQVIDLHGNTLFQSDTLTTPMLSSEDFNSITSSNDEGMMLSSNGIYLVAYSPVYNNNIELIAYISVGVPYSLITDKVTHLIKASIVTAMLCLLVAVVILLFVITRVVLDPLDKLRLGIQAIVSEEQPNYDVTIDTASNDEFADIAKAFTTTTQILKRKDRALRHSMQDLDQQGKFLRNVLQALEHIPSNTVIFDNDGNIEYTNTQLLNHENECNNLIGQPADSLGIPLLTSNTQEAPWEQARNSKNWIQSYPVALDDGRTAWYEAQLIAVRAQDGSINNYLLMIENRSVNLDRLPWASANTKKAVKLTPQNGTLSPYENKDTSCHAANNSRSSGIKRPLRVAKNVLPSSIG